MKKPLSLALAALTGAALLTSCSSRNQADDSSGAKQTVIGISIPAADHGWTGGIVYWAKKAQQDIQAANPGVKVLLSSAKDPADQVSGIENLLVQDIQALVVLPHEPAPLTPICKQVVASGVKLIVVDRGLTEKIMDYSVVGDNTGFGRVSGEQVAKTLGGKGKIAFMEGVLCQVNTDRVTAFKKALEAFPDIEIVDSGVSDWSTEKGLKLMENLLQKHPALDAVWAGDDDVLLGALKAYQDSKRTDLKLLLGGGGSKAVVKLILDKNPLVSQTVTYPPKMIYVAAQRALDLLNGKDLPAVDNVEVIPAEVIDASNAAENYFPDSAY